MPSTCPISSRQIEILHWKSLGKTTRETAQILGCSRCTINTHMEKAFLQTNAVNAASLIAMALRKGWMK